MPKGLADLLRELGAKDAPPDHPVYKTPLVFLRDSKSGMSSPEAEAAPSTEDPSIPTRSPED